MGSQVLELKWRPALRSARGRGGRMEVHCRVTLEAESSRHFTSSKKSQQQPSLSSGYQTRVCCPADLRGPEIWTQHFSGWLIDHIYLSSIIFSNHPSLFCPHSVFWLFRLCLYLTANKRKRIWNGSTFANRTLMSYTKLPKTL